MKPNDNCWNWTFFFLFSFFSSFLFWSIPYFCYVYQVFVPIHLNRFHLSFIFNVSHINHLFFLPFFHSQFVSYSMNLGLLSQSVWSFWFSQQSHSLHLTINAFVHLSSLGLPFFRNVIVPKKEGNTRFFIFLFWLLLATEYELWIIHKFN